MANGVELASAYVSLTVDGSQINSGVRRSLAGVESQADSVGRSSGRKMGSGISSGVLGAVGRVAGPLAAIFAGIQVGKILSSSIDEALEARKVSAVTDAIVKSTGGAAKVTAKQVGDLSEALSKKIGVDDEAIQTGANLLLTFKNVRNEAGKGNKVFDSAVGAAQNLSAAGFGSIESASKMLGKALNDPEKGLTMLSRAGVQFSDAQKKQIKEALKNNDLLTAQKIILGEVESQVGGVAEATATTSDKVGVAWDNLKESVGTALLPALDRLGNWFLEKGLPAIQKFGTWVKDKLWPALKDGWETIRPGLEKAQGIIMGAFGEEGGGASVKDFATFITDKLIPGIAEFVNVWLPIAATQFAATVEAIKGIYNAFKTVLDIQARVASAVIGAFIKVTDTAAAMLDALSVVPGFGWAKDAADKLRGVSATAAEVKTAIDNIPNSKTIKISVEQSYTATGTGRFNNDGIGYAPGRETGGPVRKGQPYIVGEKRPELFVPNQSGKILPRVPESAPAALGGFGIDYYLLEDAVAAGAGRARPSVSVRQLESARSEYLAQRSVR